MIVKLLSNDFCGCEITNCDCMIKSGTCCSGHVVVINVKHVQPTFEQHVSICWVASLYFLLSVSLSASLTLRCRAVSSAPSCPSEGEVVNINKAARGNKSLTSLNKEYKYLQQQVATSQQWRMRSVCYLLPELNDSEWTGYWRQISGRLTGQNKQLLPAEAAF